MHTTSQAAELWCPMVRVARREDATPNTPGSDSWTVVAGVNHDALSGANKRMSDVHMPLASCRCIAGKCAMWRWSEPAPLRHFINDNVFNPTGPGAETYVFVAADEADGEPAQWVETETAANARRTGYCGLACKP